MLKRLQTVRYSIGGVCETIEHAFVHVVSDRFCYCVSRDDAKVFLARNCYNVVPHCRSDVLTNHLLDSDIPGQKIICPGMYILTSEDEVVEDVLRNF